MGGGDPGHRRGALGRERRADLGQRVELHDERLEAPELRATRDHLADQSQQEVGVGAWPDEVVRAGELRGLGPAGIDDHHGAALAHFPKSTAHVGRAHDAAVAGQRVGAQHQHVVAAIDVGDREEQLVPEHLVAREHVRELVDAGGAEAIACAQPLEQQRTEE